MQSNLNTRHAQTLLTPSTISLTLEYHAHNLHTQQKTKADDQKNNYFSTQICHSNEHLYIGKLVNRFSSRTSTL